MKDDHVKPLHNGSMGAKPLTVPLSDAVLSKAATRHISDTKFIDLVEDKHQFGLVKYLGQRFADGLEHRIQVNGLC